jgi:hypothetical protein
MKRKITFEASNAWTTLDQQKSINIHQKAQKSIKIFDRKALSSLVWFHRLQLEHHRTLRGEENTFYFSPKTTIMNTGSERREWELKYLINDFGFFLFRSMFTSPCSWGGKRIMRIMN